MPSFIQTMTNCTEPPVGTAQQSDSTTLLRLRPTGLNERRNNHSREACAHLVNDERQIDGPE